MEDLPKALPNKYVSDKEKITYTIVHQHFHLRNIGNSRTLEGALDSGGHGVLVAAGGASGAGGDVAGFGHGDV